MRPLRRVSAAAPCVSAAAASACSAALQSMAVSTNPSSSCSREGARPASAAHSQSFPAAAAAGHAAAVLLLLLLPAAQVERPTGR